MTEPDTSLHARLARALGVSWDVVAVGIYVIYLLAALGFIALALFLSSRR